jgi:hypothetical protein
MRIKLQLVICHDDGHEETVTDVITLNPGSRGSGRVREFFHIPSDLVVAGLHPPP